jgi:hypothetical protein
MSQIGTHLRQTARLASVNNSINRYNLFYILHLLIIAHKVSGNLRRS